MALVLLAGCAAPPEGPPAPAHPECEAQTHMFRGAVASGHLDLAGAAYTPAYPGWPVGPQVFPWSPANVSLVWWASEGTTAAPLPYGWGHGTYGMSWFSRGRDPEEGRPDLAGGAPHVVVRHPHGTPVEAVRADTVAFLAFLGLREDAWVDRFLDSGVATDFDDPPQAAGEPRVRGPPRTMEYALPYDGAAPTEDLWPRLAGNATWQQDWVGPPTLQGLHWGLEATTDWFAFTDHHPQATLRLGTRQDGSVRGEVYVDAGAERGATLNATLGRLGVTLGDLEWWYAEGYAEGWCDRDDGSRRWPDNVP